VAFDDSEVALHILDALHADTAIVARGKSTVRTASASCAWSWEQSGPHRHRQRRHCGGERIGTVTLWGSDQEIRDELHRDLMVLACVIALSLASACSPREALQVS